MKGTNEMETKPKDVCRGFVQLHLNGVTGGNSLQGQNIHVYGYTLYSCGEILSTYSNGKFYINMDETKKATYRKHRDHMVKAVNDVNPNLAVLCKNSDEMKDMLKDTLAFKLEKRRDIANILYMMLESCVSSSYAQKILDEIIDNVVNDVDETADPTEWNDDDVRLAAGRAILAKLQMYQML